MLGGNLMSSIEIEAKTAQEAVEKACEHFHLSKEELDIEVLEDRSTGIFGIVGNKKAKIRVTPKKDDSMVVAQETLEKIISLISADTRISAERKADEIILNITGNNTGILIGHRGKTLEAIEYIVNKAVNKASEKKVRVIVDSENYRKRRDESLKTLAFQMAEKAKKTNRTATIDPISPRDRRIVHLALKGDHRISTKSEGEGLFKRIFIIPNKEETDEK
jgi:spoIIIJ-associated protein